jgi:hypothetical protein
MTGVDAGRARGRADWRIGVRGRVERSGSYLLRRMIWFWSASNAAAISPAVSAK